MIFHPPIITPELIIEGLGAFDELDFLGAGTFGDTYRAVRDDDVYALKVIRFEDMPEYLWEREIAALERVDHPNVVGFRRAGRLVAQGKSYPFLECEFIDGGDVKSRIERAERIESSESLKAFITGLLAGVNEIHDLGILHRDIKPANISLRDGLWSWPVILDFGLARALDMSSHTEYPAHIGTVLYMSPEQLRGAPARRRSDLYAVGVVAYEGGTGQHPFGPTRGLTAQDLHDRIKAGAVTDPREISDAFDDDLAKVVLRLLSYWGHERLGVEEAFHDLE